MAQVLSRFSATLSDAVHLTLKVHPEGDHRTGDVEWLQLLRQFPTAQTLHVSQELARLVALALENLAAEMVPEVLPLLDSICLVGQPASSVEKFVATRRRSGRPIAVQISYLADTACSHPSHRSENIAFPPLVPPISLLGLGRGQLAPAPNRTMKKIRVNLPKESVLSGDGRLPSRSSFARTPIPHLFPLQPPGPGPQDTRSTDICPPDPLRVKNPHTIKVFLPRRSAWEALKKKFVDEKLEKLGVEDGISRPILQIHAPRAQLAVPQDVEPLNADEHPFTLPALGGIDIGAIEEAALQGESPGSDGEWDGDVDEEEDGNIEDDVDYEHELPSMEASYAPNHLDFKQTASTNTAPAGLFQENGSGGSNGNSNNASIAGEDEEQRSHWAARSRSRSGSREISEYASCRPSLDDLHSPANSDKASLECFFNNPDRWDAPAPLQEQPQLGRDRCDTSSTRSSFSNASVHLQDIQRRLELLQYEERLEALLERKLEDFREEVRALRAESSSTGKALQDKTSELLALHQDVLSRLVSLPDSVTTSIKAAQLADAELLAHTVTEDVEEAQCATATYSDLQLKLARVRAQCDTVRAEKYITPKHIASEREDGYADLQRRYGEQISDRASREHAQQRASEWEQRANKNEAALKEPQALRNQAEDRAARLEAELSLLRMQLDDKDALAKDRESKLCDQVAALEARVADLLAADAESLNSCAVQ
ncbi:hypothetical protein EI94DRAFT_1813472 [Lactarius quietus]|nr:hypothetical protein EI94DRAFT_1813472 [Lactarius quietus]